MKYTDRDSMTLEKIARRAASRNRVLRAEQRRVGDKLDAGAVRHFGFRGSTAVRGEPE